jgi:3-oxoadipate enol-lactonase
LRWTTGSFLSDGEDIYYEVTGSGDRTIVFSHGLGGNHAVWFQQIPVFAELFRVVTWDQRGFGRSSDRAGATGPPAAVVDLGRLFDELGIERAHLVGQSMGGWATLGFALASTERVASMVLADSAAGVADARVGEAMTSVQRRTIEADTMGAHPAVGPDTDAIRTFLYQQIGGFRSELDEAAVISRLMTTRYERDAVASLGVPTLCIVGAQDDVIPPAAIRAVAEVLGGRYVEIAGAGHSPYFEQPDAWNQVVLEFVGGLS